MREMFYRDHGEQSRIHFKFCCKCVNREQQEVVFQVRVTSTALPLQVKKPCPESDGSEPQNPRYSTGGPMLTDRGTVAEGEVELCCAFVASHFAKNDCLDQL